MRSAQQTTVTKPTTKGSHRPRLITDRSGKSQINKMSVLFVIQHISDFRTNKFRKDKSTASISRNGAFVMSIRSLP